MPHLVYYLSLLNIKINIKNYERNDREIMGCLSWKNGIHFHIGSAVLIPKFLPIIDRGKPRLTKRII